MWLETLKLKISSIDWDRFWLPSDGIQREEARSLAILMSLNYRDRIGLELQGLMTLALEEGDGDGAWSQAQELNVRTAMQSLLKNCSCEDAMTWLEELNEWESLALPQKEFGGVRGLDLLSNPEMRELIEERIRQRHGLGHGE